ncbi:MAG TPA: DUF2786 domain-containing protein [Iamia sp.]|nr:DUF2786 domain-containing protein [Iamia sp.]
MSFWRRPAPPDAERPPLGAGDVRQLLLLVGRGRRDAAQAARRALLAAPTEVVVPGAEGFALEALDELWSTGWQPAEVVWQARRRRVGAGTAAVGAVAAAAVGWPAGTLHPAWRGQLDDLGITPGGAPPARGWAADPAAAVDLVGVLLALPPIEVLLPVPGRPDVAVASAVAGADLDGIDAKVLERVRALLAKAESSTFEAEAQAFTAKAHELMTRHALEHALVATGPGADDRPVARRICIDDPYADAKAHLLAVIAQACRSTAVLLGGLQMATLVGFASDLAEVDVLFTSLLVQAQAGLDQLSRASEPGSRERTRGFRSSFLRGFAHRIGDRLQVAGAATVADLDRESGGALVPVMAERREAVDHHVAEMHPHLRTKHVAGPSDRLGWYAGRQAADRADLPRHRLTTG